MPSRFQLLPGADGIQPEKQLRNSFRSEKPFNVSAASLPAAAKPAEVRGAAGLCGAGAALHRPLQAESWPPHLILPR